MVRVACGGGVGGGGLVVVSELLFSMGTGRRAQTQHITQDDHWNGKKEALTWL